MYQLFLWQMGIIIIITANSISIGSSVLQGSSVHFDHRRIVAVSVCLKQVDCDTKPRSVRLRQLRLKFHLHHVSSSGQIIMKMCIPVRVSISLVRQLEFTNHVT